MQMQAESSAGALSEQEILSFTEMIRADLPGFEFDPAYVEFLHQHNGGCPVKRFYPATGDFGGSIDQFLNFADTTSDAESTASLNTNAVWSAIEDRLSIYLVPFATNGHGDYLCFDHEDSYPPRIQLWVQELSEEDEPRLEFVSNSFIEFVDSLRDEPY